MGRKSNCWSASRGQSWPAFVGLTVFVVLWAGCAALAGLDDDYVLGQSPGGGTAGAGAVTTATGTHVGGTSAGGTSAGGVGATGGGGFGTGGQGASTTPGCSNGKVEPPETCDDGNSAAGDGCTACEVDPGYTCSGDLSDCTPISAQVVTVGPGLALAIPCVAYDGSLATMGCTDLVVPDNGFPTVQRVEATVAIDHAVASDLVVKLVSPQGTTLSLVSRPGLAEPYDAEYLVDGNVTHVAATDPLRFADGAGDDAETMGSSLTTVQTICRDDGRCAYDPNPGAGPGTNLADFQGQNAFGTWRLCVADAFGCGVRGTLQGVLLSVLSW